jgi:hypothetical protein
MRSVAREWTSNKSTPEATSITSDVSKPAGVAAPNRSKRPNFRPMCFDLYRDNSATSKWVRAMSIWRESCIVKAMSFLAIPCRHERKRWPHSACGKSKSTIGENKACSRFYFVASGLTGAENLHAENLALL